MTLRTHKQFYLLIFKNEKNTHPKKIANRKNLPCYLSIVSSLFVLVFDKVQNFRMKNIFKDIDTEQRILAGVSVLAFTSGLIHSNKI